MSRVSAALPGIIGPLLQDRIGNDLDVTWWMDAEQAVEAASEAEIGWFDMFDKQNMARAIEAAGKLKWLNSIYAGIDEFPLDTLRARGAVLTNGVGLNAIPVAEYAVMGMLAAAKRFDKVLEAQAHRQWLQDSPGKAELYESKALVIGYGAIGRRIAQMLAGFEVEVTAVRRSPDPDPKVLGPDEWRARLGEFDWVILAAPHTGETERLIGAAELAAMKATAWLVNIARGPIVDQAALVAALEAGEIGGVFADTTDPEPLPADDPLWAAPNALVTMHLSGRSQTRLFQRAADRFVENLERYRKGEPLHGVADLDLGY